MKVSDMPDEVVPDFKSEEEEAEWWSSHSETFARRFEDGLRTGRVRRLSQTALPGASDAGRVHIPSADMKRVRDLASRRGMTPDVYVTKLLHEALDAEEKKLAS